MILYMARTKPRSMKVSMWLATESYSTVVIWGAKGRNREILRRARMYCCRVHTVRW